MFVIPVAILCVICYIVTDRSLTCPASYCIRTELMVTFGTIIGAVYDKIDKNRNFGNGLQSLGP